MLFGPGIAAPPAWQRPGALVFAGDDGKLSADAIHHDAALEGAPFLAIKPPAATPPEAWRRSLPLSSARLLAGEPYTLLAIGDSVTATGPYPEILAKLIMRATGNPDVRVVRAAYSGKSVDAAVRRWATDVGPVKPDLAIIMFGLNDQASGSPIEAYLEQMEWLADHLRAECQADVIFMEPTPHIEPEPAAGMFRTVGFGAGLRELGRRTGVPVAPTFDAIWGEGAEDLQATARGLWRFYPRSYREPFTSMADHGGRGDTIHPNVLGHLAMARAVFDTLANAGGLAAPSLSVSGTTRRTEGAPSSLIELRNETAHARAGVLDLYPWPGDDKHFSHAYELAPHGCMQIEFRWPVEGDAGIMAFPANKIFGEEGPLLQVVDRHAGHARVRAVRLPWSPEASWVRERSESDGRLAVARLREGGEFRTVPVTLPAGSDVGRLPLRETLGSGEGEVVGELAYVRYGRATPGESITEGDLGEWAGADWVAVGEPVQARTNRGQTDFRKNPMECYPRWAFKAGRDGIHLAFQCSGNPTGDRLTVLFDPRHKAELGTVGPYYWVSGALKAGGSLALAAGDSSPASDGLRGVWRMTEPAMAIGELYVPYAVMGSQAWPASGDLGLSIVWEHFHDDGNVTRLMWSEDGHRWTPRWFGVVRRGADGELPYRIRVR